MHESFKVVQIFLGIKFGPSGYVVCNTDYDKSMRVIQMSKWFASRRHYTDLDFKPDTSLPVGVFHSIVECPLKSSDR